MAINPDMDTHAAVHGLAHWTCVSHSSNDKWQRSDGRQCETTFQGKNGYIDDLREFDRLHPLSAEAIDMPVVEMRGEQINLRIEDCGVHYMQTLTPEQANVLATMLQTAAAAARLSRAKWGIRDDSIHGLSNAT